MVKRRLFTALLSLSVAAVVARFVMGNTVIRESANELSSATLGNRLKFALFTKRAFDIVISAAALTALLPVLLTIALLVRFSSPGPIFYKATRVGQGGRLFKVYKFRSMVINADQVGPRVTGMDDPRITPIGRILRRTKLDELPQLLNVLRGEMSLVGPRPEDPSYVQLYTPEQRAVLRVRPGITGPASVVYRDEESLLAGADREVRYVQEIMPAKLAIDLDYVRNVSLKRDLKIISDTILAL